MNSKMTIGDILDQRLKRLEEEVFKDEVVEFVLIDILGAKFRMKKHQERDEEGNRITKISYEDAIKNLKLINSAQNKRDKLLFLFGGTMGMRVSEVVSSKVENYNQEERTFTVLDGKTGDRLIPVPQFTADFLDLYISYFKLKPHDWIFSVRVYRGGVERVERNSHLTRWQANRICNGYEKRLGVPRLHYHMLRHSYVTVLLERGVDPITIKENCGWSDMRMLEVYAHLVIEARKRKTDFAFNFLGEQQWPNQQPNMNPLQSRDLIGNFQQISYPRTISTGFGDLGDRV